MAAGYCLNALVVGPRHGTGCWTRFASSRALLMLSYVSEMAERHNTKQILKLARDLVYKVQTLIENK